MKFSEKFKKNKGEAAVPETAQDSGKKKHKPDPKKLVGTISKKHIKNGSYSMAMAAVFIVIVVVINMIVGAIPSKYSQLDVSSSKLYTIGDETKKVLKALDKDVTIYQIAASGSEDDTISNLLSRYKDESKHIKVEVKDPVVNPKFASEYTTDDLASNSLIVVCGDRNKVINYKDMYSSSVDYNTWQQTTTGFDGEGQITSALDYVLNDDMPKVYMTTGHNELSLSNTFTSALNKENVDYETVNLMDLDAIPDDAACLFINGATSDFSSDDKDKVIDYLNNGGKVILVTGYTDEETPNIDAILSYMNLSIAKGLVVENDSNGYYRSPYYILPTQSSDSYTSGTYGKYLFLPYSQGIIVPEKVSTDETAIGDITYDVFLSTSDSAFAKQDVSNAQDFSQGENDVNGPFALGVEAVKTLDDGDATLIVYGCEQLFTDDANSVVSGANLTLFTNTFSGMADHETSVSIPVKSYEVSNLVVDSAQILLLGLLVTVILPIGCMIAGFVIWFRRRKR